jgi:hypothetical protein
MDTGIGIVLLHLSRRAPYHPSPHRPRFFPGAMWCVRMSDPRLTWRIHHRSNREAHIHSSRVKRPPIVWEDHSRVADTEIVAVRAIAPYRATATTVRTRFPAWPEPSGRRPP